MGAAMFPKVVGEIVDASKWKDADGCGGSKAGETGVAVSHPAFAEIRGFLERHFHGRLLFHGGSRDVESPNFGNPDERPSIAESQQFTVPTGAPGLERSSKSMQLLGLSLKPVMARLVERDVVVDVPVVCTLTPIVVVQYESDEKDVASC